MPRATSAAPAARSVQLACVGCLLFAIVFWSLVGIAAIVVVRRVMADF
ncbi:MAG: hypothetical protein IPH13_18185 [Planctomycetes bacterium]|nr:hypothetical protein [Planctomycetota bacterium]MCC7171868.1 hypothetical protein [Planctomycetota bacterium]